MLRARCTAIVLAAAALAAAGLLAAPAASDDVELDLESLARCIADSGAVFYGAHWCPFCRRQMEAFGPHASLLPYVECYDGSKREGMNQTCRSQQIHSFPTWIFPDGSVERGVRDPSALARATGCG